MRALYEAALLLASVFARGTTAASSEYASAAPSHSSSAYITLQLADPEPNYGNPYLSFRLDIWASSDPCSLANVTINNQPLPAAAGSLAIDLDGPDAQDDTDRDPSSIGQASIEWTSSCLAWYDDQEREHRLKLRVASVNGQTTTPGADANAHHSTRALPPSYDLSIRFRQSLPVRIMDVEGAASVFRFDSDSSRDGRIRASETDGSDEQELLAWQQSLAALHQQARLVQHDTRMREQYMRHRFGEDALHCSSHCVSSFFGSIMHKIGILIGHDSDKTGGYYQSALGGSAASSPGWEELYSPSANTSSCLGANGTAQAFYLPLLPPSPPPFLVRPPCSLPSSPDTVEQGTSSGESSSNSGNTTDTTDTTDSGADSGSTYKDVASSIASGFRKSHASTVYGFLMYLVVLFIIAFVIMASARRYRERHGHGQHMEDSDSDSGSSLRGRISQQWHKLSTRFHERRSRRKQRRLDRVAHRQSLLARRRERAAAEDEQDRFFDDAIRARLVWLVRRLMYGRDADREKLVGSGSGPGQSAGQGHVNGARGHIEAVAVPAPDFDPELASALGRETEQASSSSAAQITLEQQRQLQEQQARLQFYAQQRLRDEQQQRQQHLLEVEQQIQWEREEAERQQMQQWRQRQQLQLQQQRQERQEQQGASILSSDLRTPSPTLEQEIASFRAAADVVDQIIAAEEGRVTTTRRAAATAQRQQDQKTHAVQRDLQRAQRAQSSLSSLARPSPAPRAVARTQAAGGPSFVHQPPPPPPPPPSTVSVSLSQASTAIHAPSASSRVAAGSTPAGRDYGYSQREAIGVDSDYEETESLPPAYSETNYTAESHVTMASAGAAASSTPATEAAVYTYDERAVAEANMVADGFQYQPSSSRYY